MMHACGLCAFPDDRACDMLERHERVEYVALSIVLAEQLRQMRLEEQP